MSSLKQAATSSTQSDLCLSEEAANIATDAPDVEKPFDARIVLDVRDGEVALTADRLMLTPSSPGKSQKWSCMLGFAQPSSSQAINLYDVLWAEMSDTNLLTVEHVGGRGQKHILRLPLGFVVSPDSGTVFVEALMTRAYPHSTQRQRRALVLINPHAGRGLARRLWVEEAQPVFAAARWRLDVKETTRPGEALDIAEALDIDAYNCVVVCSGDGLAHEVFNGLGRRPDAARALASIAIAHIPCGSGNALSCNVNGTTAAAAAAAAIVKGRDTAIDLVSVTQAGASRTLSFLSQALGMMAECDLATEHLRWMGDTRFTYGYLTRAITRRVYPCEIAVKVVAPDKAAVKAHYKRYLKVPVDHSSERAPVEGLPPLQFGTVDDPIPKDWEIVQHENLSNLYAGRMPYMADKLNFFPAALPNDGTIDLVHTLSTAPLAAVGLTFVIDSNGLFDSPLVTYRKVAAFRVTPRRQNNGYISVDGERVPFAAFQAEVHRGLGRIVTRSGKYEAPGPKGWAQDGEQTI